MADRDSIAMEPAMTAQKPVTAPSKSEVRRLLNNAGVVVWPTRDATADRVAEMVTLRRDVAPPTVDPIYAAVVA
jgi:hypothetical protein